MRWCVCVQATPGERIRLDGECSHELRDTGSNAIGSVGYVIVGVALLLVPAGGCASRLDPSRSGDTKNNLCALGKLVEELDARGIDVSHCDSVKDIIRLGKENKLVQGNDYIEEYHEQDGWKRPLRVKNNGTIVTIISDGPNGVPEDGRGDDLSVAVTLTVVRRSNR